MKPDADNALAVIPGDPLRGVVVLSNADAAVRVEQLGKDADFFAGCSLAPRTLEAYRWAWAVFTRWCAIHRRAPLPATAETIRLFATAAVQEGLPRADGSCGRAIGVRGLAVQLAAIRAAHERSGVELEKDAALRQTLKGIRRVVGAPPKKKGHFSVAQIRAMVQGLPSGLRGLRDRALLLVAYASGGRRRSEVTAMDIEHLQADGENILWTLPRSKTDQEGRGFEAALFRVRDPELCAVRALTAWISAAGITSGPVFRQVDRWEHVSSARVLPRTVASVVKESATRIGLDPKDYGGHSLRASFATNAARAGARLEDIQARTGHRDLETLMEYIRRGRVLERDSTAEIIGG